MNNPPFIPGWLDDAGLSQSEFRVYCHLCRRADNKTGIAWPQAESIAQACRMSRNTVWKVIRSLESKGLIRRVGKPFAGSNRYQIFVPPIGAKETPNETDANRTKSEPPIGAKESRQSDQMERHKGSPKKVLQRRESSQRGCKKQVKRHGNQSRQSTVSTGRRSATIEEA